MERLDNHQVLARLHKDGVVEDADISGFEPADLDVDEPGFLNCVVRNAHFSGGALTESRWRGCTFLSSALVNLDLADARFENCKFYEAGSDENTSFKFCDLRRAEFLSCDLSMASFASCDMYMVAMNDCRMRGSRFEASTFSQTMSGRAVKSSARFTACDFSFAELDKLYLADCVFQDCSFREANLSNTVFRDADMSGSDFTNAQLDAVDFSGADLRRADLSGMSLYTLSKYRGMMISAGQQHGLMRSMGIDVHPD